jgi:hypothetical protein
MDFQGRAYHLATSFARLDDLDFFFPEYIKDIAYVLPLTITMSELAMRVKAAVDSAASTQLILLNICET